MEDQEIIIHKNQTDIYDHLKEENEKCTNCRWIYGGELICVCPSSEFRGQDVSFENVESCDQYYPHDEIELMGCEDEDTGRIEF